MWSQCLVRSLVRKKLVLLVLCGLFIGLGLLLAVSCVGPEEPQKPAVLPGIDTGMKVTVEVSKPANGTNFVIGEEPVLTIALKDPAGKVFNRADDFSQLRLMLAGPQETLDTVTAVKLLKTSADRSQAEHHYIDLKTNKEVQVSGNTLTYKLAAVADEKPGTYIASVWVVSKTEPFQQVMTVAEFQVGTATVEKQIVEKEKCAPCHLGANSGKFYLHHIDQVSPANPAGNFSLDQNAVRNCKTCHNNDGYAATLAEDGKTRNVPSPIVKKIHGVHMGEHLSNPLNTDPKTGVFKLYTGVLFPANVENCAVCHVDDRWKTKPSRLACGACHDAIDWATGKSVVKDKKDHGGGPQANDAACAGCHPADTGGVKSVADAHKVSQPMNKIDLRLTGPANGKFYVAGDKPTLTLVIKDDKGNPIDHTKVDETTFSTALFFVYGPRYHPVPVLTNAAKNGDSKARVSTSSSIPASGTPTKGWTFAEGDTFKIAVNAGPVQVIPAPTGLQTPDQVRDWLKTNLKDVTVTSNNTAGSVTLLSNLQGAASSRFEIYNSPVTAKMGWKPGPLPLIKEGVRVGQTAGTTMEPFIVQANVSIPGNDMRPRSDPLNYTDPLVARSAGNITYQLDDVKDLKAGTYMLYSYVVPNGVLPGTGRGPLGQPNAAAKALNVSLTGVGFATFQVGTETPDKKVATNCSDCHRDTIWHLDADPIHPEPFDTDYCTACHDYQRFSGTGDLFSRTGGNSTSGFAGYGAKPISSRVHNLHFGKYVKHPEYGYAGKPNVFAEFIFPQDVRNCEKCHDPKTTVPAWKENPSRLACTACHDSDAALSHTALNTQNPNPADPYNSKAVETCNVCHGKGRQFSPDKVHNIANPYKPPYFRE